MAEAVGAERPLLTWSGRAVDIGQVETELVRLRYQAAGGEQTAGDAPFAIRTSLHNLVVQAADEEIGRHASQVVAALPSHHPSRTIIAVAGPAAAAARIDAELAAHCHAKPGWEQQVCCEEVTLRVSGPPAEHLHSIIVPLLVPDLPVYVWWTADLPADRHTLEEVIGSANRLIVDSARFRRTGLGRLARLAQERPRCAIGDLNWGRLTPWRQLIVQHLQTPGVSAALESVTAIDVRYVRTAGRETPSQVLLLLGWLAVRFGRQTDDANQVPVKLLPQTWRGLDPGWLTSLELRGAAGSVSFARKANDPLHLEVRLEDGRAIPTARARIESCDEGEMLARELETLGHDAEFEEALRRGLAIAKTARLTDAN